MYTTVYPMQLWKEYGIISYNIGQTSATPAISYHNLLLATKETKPKLIVLDSYLITKDYKIMPDNFKNSMHNTFDPYPISYQKYLAVKDLCENRNKTNNMIEVLFNFSTYHTRWNGLTEEDFKYENNYEKGASARINVSVPQAIIDFEKIDTYIGKETENMKYLRRIIEYCKENDVEILVTYNPYPASAEEIAASKYVKIICNKYNINYINFLDMNIVNYDIDCYDKNSHLNVSGARKVTEYIGKYIIENYEIPDQRQNKQYDFWNEDYDEYIDFKIENLKKNKDKINNYLMLLYGEEDISYEIKISSKKAIKEGSVLQKLLANLENNYQIDDTAFKENRDKTIKITTYDNRNNKLIQTVWF